jgi:hypothetical protein
MGGSSMGGAVRRRGLGVRRLVGCFLALLFSSAALSAFADPPTRGAAFTRYVDRTEGAFLLLVPQGWQTRGGMIRLNPMTAGGAGNATGAKIDFAVLREPEGRVYVRWLPAINYAQPSPANTMLGGNWNGMPIVAMPRAADYITRMLFPALHPGARGTQVQSVQPRPDAVAGLEQLPVARTMRSQGAYYVADAALAVVLYEEGGVRYKEALFVAVEGYNYMGAAMWSNPVTVAARAPEAEYAAWDPVAKVVYNSFTLNPVWLQAEMQGQADRSRIAADTLRDIARIDAEIAKNRSETMSKINDQEYLTLTGQQRYVNPHTGRQELGSNEWKYRWVNAAGDPIYTNDQGWDPNTDPALHLSGYKRSPVR